MVRLACPEVLEPIKNALHIKFFKFFELYLQETYLGEHKYVVSAGSYPLFYFIKGDADTEEKKASTERFLTGFVPNDFDLWTNLDNCGKVVNGILEFARQNSDIEVGSFKIVGTFSKYKINMGIQQILGIVNFSLQSRVTQESSLPIQVICWRERHPQRTTNPLVLLESVLEQFDISVCKVGWKSGRDLENICCYSHVLNDIRQRKFSLKFKRYENMELVQSRVVKYLSRGFQLKQIVFPRGFALRDMDYHFTPDIRDVSDSDMDETS